MWLVTAILRNVSHVFIHLKFIVGFLQIDCFDSNSLTRVQIKEYTN